MGLEDRSDLAPQPRRLAHLQGATLSDNPLAKNGTEGLISFPSASFLAED
jgi:hypothetical protein